MLNQKCHIASSLDSKSRCLEGRKAACKQGQGSRHGSGHGTGMVMDAIGMIVDAGKIVLKKEKCPRKKDCPGSLPEGTKKIL